MSRELFYQPKEKNDKRYAEILRLEADYLELQLHHSWLENEEIVNESSPLTDNEAEIKAKLFELSGSILTNKARLKLTYVFLLRHNKGLFPKLCSECFIEHDKRESSMVEVKLDPNFWEGKKQYECSVCKHVLRVDQTLNVE